MIHKLIQYCTRVGNLQVEHSPMPISLALGEESTDVDSVEVPLAAFFSLTEDSIHQVFVIPNPVDSLGATYLVVAVGDEYFLEEGKMRIRLSNGDEGTVLTSFNIGEGLVMACSAIRKALHTLEQEARLDSQFESDGAFEPKHVIVGIFRKVLRVDPTSPYDSGEEIHLSALTEGDQIRMFDSENQQYSTSDLCEGYGEVGNFVYTVTKMQRFPLNVEVEPVLFRDMAGDVYTLTPTKPK